jgi:hypothetical protein
MDFYDFYGISISDIAKGSLVKFIEQNGLKNVMRWNNKNRDWRRVSSVKPCSYEKFN